MYCLIISIASVSLHPKAGNRPTWSISDGFPWVSNIDGSSSAAQNAKRTANPNSLKVTMSIGSLIPVASRLEEL